MTGPDRLAPPPTGAAKAPSPARGSNALAPRTSARGTLLAGAAVALVLFGGLGTWMARAEIAGAVIASGEVVVRGKPRLVQHPDGGVVTRIAVSEGDVVAEGDELLTLDDTLLQSNIEVFRNRLLEALARQSRLEAERDGETEIVWRDDPFGLDGAEPHRRAQTRLRDARVETTQGRREQLAERVAQLENQIDGVEAAREADRSQLQLLNEELAATSDLIERGVTARNPALPRFAARAEVEGRLAERGAEIARLRNAIAETRVDLLQIDNELREAVLRELREATLEAAEMTQRYASTRAELNRVTLTAPASGAVLELTARNVGSVVSPGAVVMQIVPLDEGLEIEARVPTVSIDAVAIGQPASVRFSALNQRTTPELDARVTLVSASSVIDEATGEAFYRARLALEPGEVDRLNGALLVSGMPAEAFIQTEPRSALSYLVRPLTDNLARAFREE